MSYYAVHRGRQVGVYRIWKECEEQVKGYPNGRYKKFTNLEDADIFYRFGDQKPSPVEISKNQPEVREDVIGKEIDPVHLKREGDIVLFCDGACPNNGKDNAYAGWGCAFPDHPEWNCFGPIDQPTNNRAEYTAFIKGIEKIREMKLGEPILVYTDSNLLVQTINEWLPKWKAKGIIQEKANSDLVVQIDRLVTENTIRVVHVYGHGGNKSEYLNKYNQVADDLANAGALMKK